MIYLHSDSRCLAPSQNTKTRLITRALSLSPFETTLSLSLSHSLSGCVLSLFTLGRSSPSFFFNFHLIFWFFGSLVFHLCVSYSTSPSFLFPSVSPYIAVPRSPHIWFNFMFFILFPPCLYFSWFFSLCVFNASLDLFGLCGLLFMIIFNLLGTCVGNIRSCYLFKLISMDNILACCQLPQIIISIVFFSF